VQWLLKAIAFVSGATISILVPLAIARLGVDLSHNQVVGFVLFTVAMIGLLLGLYRAGKAIVLHYIRNVNSNRVEDTKSI